MGGLNEMKLRQHDKYHAAPLLLIENPPVVGGNNPAWTRRHVDFTPPYFCCCWKESPPNNEGDKKAQMEWCVGCTPLIRIWKAKRGSVWDAHRLIRIWKVKWDGVWVAHHLAGLWNNGAGGRGHKCPPPHPWFPLFLFFPLFLPPLTPFSALLAPSVFMTWRLTAGAFAVWHGTGGCCWWWVTWHSTVAWRGGRWRWVTCQMSFAHIPRWGEGR